MANRRSLKLAAFIWTLSIILVSAGCSKPAASLTAPTTSPSPTTESAPEAFTLSGRVMESAPTTPTGIGGAVLTIEDGANAGRSAVTNDLGFYSIPALQPTSFMISVAADGYVGVKRLQFVTVSRSDFVLSPVPAMHRYLLSGDISGSDGTCSDGITARPCRIIMVPVHNPGRVHASLHWSPNDLADLDLSFFQTGVSGPLARSGEAGTDVEQVALDVPGGATYEFRVTYRSGSQPANYELTITYPD